MPQAAKRYRSKCARWNSAQPCRQYHFLYSSVTWAKLRKAHLNNNPLCVECKEEGKLKFAKVVDHIIPHKGETDLFFAVSNLQSLCKLHHDRKTQKESRAQ